MLAIRAKRAICQLAHFTMLGFKRIDAHDAALQRQRIAEEFARLQPVPSAAKPEKRSVGRPKKKRDVTDVLVAGAAAAASRHTAERKEEDEPDAKRGKYTRWFDSPYIRDILRAYERSGFNAKQTVQQLQASAPDERYARLTHTTLLGWHDKDHTLKPTFQAQLDRGAATSWGGRTRAFESAPAVEEEIMSILCRMRAAGTPLNCRVVKCVMLATFQEKKPELLDQLHLSQQFISRWVREVLGWSWRARTTAASKLPADWEDQGIKMATRIAGMMGLHKVSARITDEVALALITCTNSRMSAHSKTSAIIVHLV